MDIVGHAAGDKPSLRSQFKKVRAEFTAHFAHVVRADLETHIQRLIGDLDEDGLQVCLYRPMPDETQFALTPERRFFYPRLDGDNLRFYRPRGPFKTGAFGIEEPDPAHADPLDLDKPMLVFCPALAVDTRGTRLGMGKGFYDRFFSATRLAQRAAVVYQVQVSTARLNADTWDQPMDWIVTEKMILRTLRRSN